MGASTASGTILVEVAGIGVVCKYPITCVVFNAVLWVRGKIVKELVDSVSGGLGDRGLLVSDGAESDERFVFDCTFVPKEVSNNALDVFYSGRVEWRAQIGYSRLMGLGTIVDGVILVWG